MRTEVGVRKDRWQRLTFGESNLSLITSVLKSPSSAVFPFMRLPKKSKTVTTDSTKPSLGFHSCDFRRNLATLLRHGVNRLLRCFHSCGSRRNLETMLKIACQNFLSDVSIHAAPEGTLRLFNLLRPMQSATCFHSCGSRRNLETLESLDYTRFMKMFSFMRLPKEP